jgi:photosystem II PsbX protein
MTPTLANFLWSLFWGTIVVVVPVVVGLVFISQKDKVTRS